jgi:hypothetical protein
MKRHVRSKRPAGAQRRPAPAHALNLNLATTPTMNRLSSLKRRLTAGLGLGMIVAALYAFSAAWVAGADAKDEKAPASSKESKPAKEPKKKAEKKKLTGAELYAIHCNRCHAERYATEWTPAQWKTIMMHMRVRANLPASQAKAIQKYLQEDSGTP